MREALALVKSGVPFDVAFALDDDTRCGWLIALGEIEGGKFDWSSMRWKEPAKP